MNGWTSYSWVTWSQLRHDAVEETDHFSHYQNEYTQCCFSTINLMREKPSHSKPKAAAECYTSSKLLPILDSIQFPLQSVLCWKSTTEGEQTSVQEKKTNWRFVTTVGDIKDSKKGNKSLITLMNKHISAVCVTQSPDKLIVIMTERK